MEVLGRFASLVIIVVFILAGMGLGRLLFWLIGRNK